MVLLNNKILTFHDLFTFTEFITKNYHMGEGYYELLVNLADYLFIVILLFHVHP